ncbi:MAG: DUF1501 domain-containing protein, partial [Pirellulales bacterium]
MLGSGRRCCDGWTRRETLRAGALTALGGFGLPQFLAAREALGSTAPQGKAKSVIVLYLLGGAASQDMYDLKPNAPSEVRGEFNPIDTAVPGIQVCEHLPQTARWMHRSAIVRSVNHKAGCHNTLPSYTGYEEPLDNIVSTKDTYPPSMGSVCEYLNQQPGVLPAYVYMPCYLGWGQSIVRPGPYAGFLGRRYDPMFTECNPHIDKDAPRESPGHPQVLRGQPRIPDSVLGEGLTIDRLNSRRGLVEQIDQQLRLAEGQGALDQYARQRQRAFSLLTSPEAKAAFDLDAEDPKLRERYGRTLFGESALVARRLVEAGVRFVNVTWDCYWERLQLQYDCWDTHTRNFPIMREYNLPYLDLTYGALLDDLDSRGLLDETLVVVMSDFGRTPRINGNGGRDHWTFCYSILFAGAGIRGGTVYGASDSQAAYVADKPVSTADICTTIYQLLGIDPETT